LNTLAFHQDEETNAAVSKTYGPALSAIEQTELGAASIKGAIEAVRLAYDEAKDSFCEPAIPALLRAALAFFDKLPGKGGQQ